MIKLHEKFNEENGFSLVEILISIFIMSIVVASASAAYIFSTKSTINNELRMHAINIANEKIENIRALNFVDVGTKLMYDGVYVEGDPGGDILQEEVVVRDGLEFLVKTDISWEEEAEWDLSGFAEWDYKSVRVSVTPLGNSSYHALEQKVETYVTRDFSQPSLPGCNIRIRCTRGWMESEDDIQVVQGINAKLYQGSSLKKFVNTSSKGVASFLNLDPGSYKVEIDPSVKGYMLYPGTSLTLNYNNLGDLVTENTPLRVEKPCSLRLVFKDLSGNSITSSNFSSGSKGRVSIIHPYPADTTVATEFETSNINSQGRLSTKVSNLWPVGDGYPGAYNLTNVTISGFHFIGGYVNNGGSQVIWNGKFDSPDSEKEITLYFTRFPNKPAGIHTDWVDGRRIRQGSHTAEEKVNNVQVPLEAGIIESSNLNDTLRLEQGNVASFNGKKIFVENVGNGNNPGLTIRRNALLNLHGREIIFKGKVKIENSPSHSSPVGISLNTTWEDGTETSNLYGSSIDSENPAIANVLFGKLYLTEPLYLDDKIVVNEGGYYFPDGIILPDEYGRLIPFTKENYVD